MKIELPASDENPADADVHFLDDRINEYNFETTGIAGLVPKKRGPRGPHKLQGEILAFVEKQHIEGEPIRARELARAIREEFSIEVHPRTIERALAGKKTPR